MQPARNARLLRLYCEARQQIVNCDVLLFRSRGAPWWQAIAAAGRSEYTHVGMAGWWDGDLMIVEMTSGGGRAQKLSNVVERWPGCIDVYGLRPEFDRVFNRRIAMAAMRDITGKPYGKLNIVLASLYHLPVARLFVPPDLADHEDSPWPPFCSQAVSKAYREGGPTIDLVPNLADRVTEPGDIARSAILQYRFTLDWKA